MFGEPVGKDSCNCMDCFRHHGTVIDLVGCRTLLNSMVPSTINVDFSMLFDGRLHCTTLTTSLALVRHSTDACTFVCMYVWNTEMLKYRDLADGRRLLSNCSTTMCGPCGSPSDAGSPRILQESDIPMLSQDTIQRCWVIEGRGS